MRKAAIWIGLLLVLAGVGLGAATVIMQPAPRESLPVVTGTVEEMWRYVQRSGTDLRVRIAPAEGNPQTLWIAINQITPAAVGVVRGRTTTVRHASNGQIMEMIVDGRTVIDYATAANKRSAGLATNRWIAFGLFMAGVALASIGLVFGR